MSCNIINLGESERQFIDEWHNNEPFITAHTSGSTGKPKEIRLLKTDMIQSARSTNRRFGITSSSRMLCPLSVNYIAGKMMMVRAMEAGCELIMEKPSNNAMVADYGAVDLMAVVPSQCLQLMKNPVAIKRLKNLIVGGASIPQDTESRLTQMPWQSFATYGMTETCSHVALRHCGESEYEAMPGISFTTDSRDCLVINAPDFSFSQLTTNDIVRLADSSHFHWLGRYDNVINSGGIKLFPEEIEKKLHGALPEPFYIHGIPDGKWGEAVALTLLTGSISEADALSLCRSILPPHEVPKHIRFVESMAYTHSGKLRRL